MCIQTMEKMEDGDILVWCDSGSSILKSGEARFLDYINMTIQHATGVTAFAYSHTSMKILTKMDTIVAIDPMGADLPHIENGVFFIKKCRFGMDLLKEWSMWCSDYHHISHEESVIPNYIGFTVHQSDQSIFGLLCNMKHVNVIVPDEIEPESHVEGSLYPFRLDRISDPAKGTMIVYLTGDKIEQEKKIIKAKKISKEVLCRVEFVSDSDYFPELCVKSCSRKACLETSNISEVKEKLREKRIVLYNVVLGEVEMMGNGMVNMGDDKFRRDAGVDGDDGNDDVGTIEDVENGMLEKSGCVERDVGCDAGIVGVVGDVLV